MKSVITFVVAVAVIVASQLYLNAQQAKQVLALASQLASNRQQDQVQISALTQKLEAVQKAVGAIKTESASAQEAEFQALRERLDTAIATQDYESLEKLRNAIDGIINSGRLFQDHTHLAEEAFDLAESAKASSDTKLAGIYYLSAINHAPSEYRFLQAYFDLIMDMPEPRPEDIAQLRSVLQLSTYQVPPARIAELLSLDDKAALHEDAALARQTPAPQAVNWEHQLNDLNTATIIGEAWADSKRIATLVDSLTDIVDSLRQDQPESELVHRAETELDLSQRVLRATLLASTLDTLMTNLNASINQPEKAISLLQTAEATLGQLWGIDPTDLPNSLRSKMDGYPTTIKFLSEVFAINQSKAPRNKIVSLENQTNELAKTKPTTSGPNGALQKLINTMKMRAAEIFSESKIVTSVEGQEVVEKALKSVEKNLAEVQHWQFDAYQKWALEKMQAAFSDYDSQTIVTADDAWRIFRMTKLAAVDQRLLAPDVGQAFSDLMGKLLAKLGDKAFKMQKEGALEAKKRLEDF